MDLAPLKSDRSFLIKILQDAGCIVKGSQVRCAFHNSNGTHAPEKHSSGSIFCQKGVWLYRCHGCNDTGDCLHWVARANNKTDAEVIEHLASTGEILGVGQVVPKPTPPPNPKEIPYAEFSQEVDQFVARADSKWLQSIADDLGVTVDSLKQFRVGRHEFSENSQVFPCIAVPMYDTLFRICGIRYRAISRGQKKSRYLSRNGIFIPTPTPFHSVLWIAEGCTDPIALTSIGLWAIGLPAASQGIDIVDAYCEKHRPKAIVAMQDNNKAGRASATLVCRALIGRELVIKSIPSPEGTQDVRGWIKGMRAKGKTDKEIKSDLLDYVAAARPMLPKAR